MANTIFRFKQFAIDQQGSSMKVNTDGVLLGAKAASREPKTILDIGTGTGVIALMLAQRFPDAQVHALEINKEASQCAEKNFRNSPFSSRLEIHALDFRKFRPQLRYDLIVSNPPFFINALQSADEPKKMARHAEEDFYHSLFSLCYHWLTEEGTLQLIWPPYIQEACVKAGQMCKWFLQKEIKVRSYENSKVVRLLSTFSKKPMEAESEEFIIYQEQAQYSVEYYQLLKPFFLKF